LDASASAEYYASIFRKADIPPKRWKNQKTTWRNNSENRNLNSGQDICFFLGLLYDEAFNPLKPSNNYMYHLLQQSITLHFVFMCFV
jgi:hypothetical protein